MTTIETALIELANRRNELAANLNTMGVDASSDETLKSLVPKVLDIEISSESGGTGIWQPHPDWWDVETMVNTSTLEWSGEQVENIRYAYVLINAADTITLLGGFSYYTSDGYYYPDGGTHTWDKIKDKECSHGYKTRCVVVCEGSRDVQFPRSTLYYLYIYLGDCNVTSMALGANGSGVSDNSSLEAIRQSKNTTFNSNVFLANYSMSGLSALKELDVFNTGLTGIGTSCFYNCYSLQIVDLSNIETIAGSSAFNNCHSLSIDVTNTKITNFPSSSFNNMHSQLSLIFHEEVTEIPASFSTLRGLKSVYIPANITNTTVSFPTCPNLFSVTVGNGFSSSLTISASTKITLASLLNLAENFADMTGLNSPTLTIGSTNLAKLNDDQKALFTAKNITLA